MWILLFWLPLCIAVGMFASIRRNRSGLGWFLIALVSSPLLAMIYVAILKEVEPVRVVGRPGLKGRIVPMRYNPQDEA